MGQYTHHIKASYSALDADALIEILRRVPSTGMQIDLNAPDTQRMITWLLQAESADHLAQRLRWRQYRYLFEYHLDYQQGGDSNPYRDWPEDMIKLFLMGWWTMLVTGERPETRATFSADAFDFAQTSYSAFGEVLDVELI